MIIDSDSRGVAVSAGKGEVAEKIGRLLTRALPPMDHREMVDAVSDCVLRLHQRHIRIIKAEENRLLPTGGKALPDDPDQAAVLAQRLVKTNDRLKHLFARRS